MANTSKKRSKLLRDAILQFSAILEGENASLFTTNVGQYGVTAVDLEDMNSARYWAGVAEEMALLAKMYSDQAGVSAQAAEDSAVVAAAAELAAGISSATAAASASLAQNAAIAAETSKNEAAAILVEVEEIAEGLVDVEQAVIDAEAAALASENARDASEASAIASAESAASALVDADRAEDYAESLQDGIRNGGYFDPGADPNLPTPVNLDTPYFWYATSDCIASGGSCPGGIDWGEGDALSYVPVAGGVVLGNYYRIAGETLGTPGPPQPITILDDLIMLKDKKIRFITDEVGPVTVDSLHVNTVGNLVLGDLGYGDPLPIPVMELAAVDLVHVLATDITGAVTSSSPVLTGITGVDLDNAQTVVGVKSFSAGVIQTAAQGATAEHLTRRDFVETQDAAVLLAANEHADTLTILTETENKVIVSANLEARNYNSGFDQWGTARHYAPFGYYPINQGLYTEAAASNKLFLGWNGTEEVGESKTKFAVSCIAGVVSNILHVNTNNSSRQSQLVLEPATDGSQAFVDGKVIDYFREVDPKYGDIASTKEESIGRCFEGDVKNGDFRLGDNGDWTSDNNTWVISTAGANATSLSSNSLYMGAAIVVGDVYTIEFTVSLVSGNLTLRDSGGTFYTAVNGFNKVTTTAGGSLFFFGTASGVTATITQVSIHKEGNEVLINPTDLIILEHFDELDNLEYFPHGMIQTGLTGTFEGFTLEDSIRPASYFQVFDGQYVDPNSVGTAVEYHTGLTIQLPKCVKLEPLSAIEGKILSTFVGEGLYLEATESSVIQRRVRQRSIRGGNGKWSSTVPWSEVNNNKLRFDTGVSAVKPQGALDFIASSLGDYTDAIIGDYMGTLNTVQDFIAVSNGVFGVRTSESVRFNNYAHNGQCFAQIICDVQRLNQGAYHPRDNEFGTREWINPTVTLGMWFLDPLFNSTRLAFTPAGTVAGEVGYRTTGYIGSTSGHPAGLLFDAVYASGQGGVVYDHRLSVTEDVDKKTSLRKAEDVNGETRGRELLKFTSVHIETQLATNLAATSVELTEGFNAANNVNVGDVVTVLSVGNTVEIDNAVISVIGTNAGLNDFITWDIKYGTLTRNAGDALPVILLQETSVEVADEYSATMVIGDPANILLTSELSDGWYGTWSAHNTGVSAELTRKGISTTLRRLQTLDNGSTWDDYSSTFDSITNTVYSGYPNESVNAVEIHSYTAHTKHTEPSNNPAIYRGGDGLGDVYISAHNDLTLGCLLNESLTGNISKSSIDAAYESTSLLTNTVDSLDRLLEYAPYYNAHNTVGLAAPDNDSHAFKALFSTTIINGLIYPVYHFTELVYEVDVFIPATMSTPMNTHAVDDEVNIVGGEFDGWYVVKNTDAATSATYQEVLDLGEIALINGNIIDSLVNVGEILLQRVDAPVGDWGDDSLVSVIDLEGTKVDLNGTTVKIGCHVGKDPIGFEPR